MIQSVRIAKLNDKATLPERKHADDAGLDLFASESAAIAPLQMAVIGTGIAIEIPKGFVGLIFLKSRSNFLLGGGVVDAGYQGEIRVKISNVRDQLLEIEEGQAIAQLLLVPIETPAVQEVSIEDLFEKVSKRGSQGGIRLPV